MEEQNWEKEKDYACRLLWLALYAFAGFSLELLLGLVSSGLSLAVNAGLTAILWSVVSIFLIHYSKSRFNFDVLAFLGLWKIKTYTNYLLSIFCDRSFYNRLCGFKPVVEFNGELKKSIIAFIFRLFYYFCRM